MTLLDEAATGGSRGFSRYLYPQERAYLAAHHEITEGPQTRRVEEVMGFILPATVDTAKLLVFDYS